MVSLRSAVSGPLPVPSALPNAPPRAAIGTTVEEWQEVWERFQRGRRDGLANPGALANGRERALTLQAAAGLDLLEEGGLADDHSLLPTLRLMRGIALEKLVSAPGPWLRAIDPQPLIAPPELLDRRALRRRWETAQALVSRPVKLGLPGPFSLAAALTDKVYGGDQRSLASAIAEALNPGLRELADAGCPAVEILEPAALQAGGIGPDAIEAIDRLWHRLGDATERWLRLLPGDLTPPWKAEESAEKAGSWERLVPALESISIDVIATAPPVPEPLARLAANQGRLRLAVIDVDGEASASEDDRADALRAEVDRLLGLLPPERLILAADGGRFAPAGALEQRLARVQRVATSILN